MVDKRTIPGKRQKRKTAFTVSLFRWIRPLCGEGPVAALTAHRAVIHSRALLIHPFFPQ